MIEINYPHGKLQIYRSRSLNPKQRYRFRFIHRNGRQIDKSSEGYRDEYQAAWIGKALVEGKYADPDWTEVDLYVDLDALRQAKEGGDVQ